MKQSLLYHRNASRQNAKAILIILIFLPQTALLDKIEEKGYTNILWKIGILYLLYIHYYI